MLFIKWKALIYAINDISYSILTNIPSILFYFCTYTEYFFMSKYPTSLKFRREKNKLAFKNQYTIKLIFIFFIFYKRKLLYLKQKQQQREHTIIAQDIAKMKHKNVYTNMTLSNILKH